MELVNAIGESVEDQLGLKTPKKKTKVEKQNKLRIS